MGFLAPKIDPKIQRSLKKELPEGGPLFLAPSFETHIINLCDDDARDADEIIVGLIAIGNDSKSFDIVQICGGGGGGRCKAICMQEALARSCDTCIGRARDDGPSLQLLAPKVRPSEVGACCFDTLARSGFPETLFQESPNMAKLRDIPQFILGGSLYDLRYVP